MTVRSNRVYGNGVAGSHWLWFSLFGLLATGAATLALRVALQLPDPPKAPVSGRLLFTGQLLAFLLAIFVGMGTELSLVDDPFALVRILGCGLVACVLLGSSAPRCFAHARASFRAARPLRGLPLHSLASLPAQGRVRVRGHLVGALDPAEMHTAELRDGDARVLVELDPARLIAPLDVTGRPLAVPADVAVEVIAELRGGDGAYRAMPVLHAGHDRLYLHPLHTHLRRRLLVAGGVDLGVALALFLCQVAFPLGVLALWLKAR